jgi:hypothetical protein
MSKPPTDPWAACREAVALGAGLKQAATTYGLSYSAVKTRACREKWPTPAKVSAAADALKAAAQPPATVAAQSWAERGEMHRVAVFRMASEALAKAKPRRLEEWADIERAARLADRAAGLDKPAPLLALQFPQVQSSELSSVIDLSANPEPNPPALDL